MNEFGDYPNPQGLPRFIPPKCEPMEPETECILCPDVAPLVLESWNQPQDHCREYGAVFPDGELICLGEDEAAAEKQAAHMAEDLKRGRLSPGEAWEGGLGNAVESWT